MKNKEIKNKTAILFEALKTCNTNTNCETCISSHESREVTGTMELDCRWCAELQRCSDGTDRNRQDWLKHKCDSHNISKVSMCPAPGQVYHIIPTIQGCSNLISAANREEKIGLWG